MTIAIPSTAGCPLLMSHRYLIFFQSEKRGGRPTDWLRATLLILLDEKGHKPFIYVEHIKHLTHLKLRSLLVKRDFHGV